MVHIKKIKTMYGLRYAVVEPMTVIKEVPVYKFVEGKDGKQFKKVVKVDTIKETVYHAVEYGEKNDKVAIFELNADGLAKAKELQNNLKKVS